MGERLSKILQQTLNIIGAGGDGTISPEALAKQTVNGNGDKPVSNKTISARIARTNDALQNTGKKVIRIGTKRNHNGGYTVTNDSEN